MASYKKDLDLPKVDTATYGIYQWNRLDDGRIEVMIADALDLTPDSRLGICDYCLNLLLRALQGVLDSDVTVEVGRMRTNEHFISFILPPPPPGESLVDYKNRILGVMDPPEGLATEGS